MTPYGITNVPITPEAIAWLRHCCRTYSAPDTTRQVTIHDPALPVRRDRGRRAVAALCAGTYPDSTWEVETDGTLAVLG